MANRSLAASVKWRNSIQLLVAALDIPELKNMVLAWDCDLCGTVMTDEKACTKCGYTWQQKCERWP